MTINTILYGGGGLSPLPPLVKRSDLTITSYEYNTNADVHSIVKVITAINYSGNANEEVTLPATDTDGSELYVACSFFSNSANNWGNITKLVIQNKIYGDINRFNEFTYANFPPNLITVSFTNGVPTSSYRVYKTSDASLNVLPHICSVEYATTIEIPPNASMITNALKFQNSVNFNESFNDLFKNTVTLNNSTNADLFRHLNPPSVVNFELPKVINFNVSFRESNNINLILRSKTLVALPSSNYISTSSTFKIYVPDDLVDSYKSANNWSNHASQIFAISEL